MLTSSIHISVLLPEVLAMLAPKPGGIFVDGTLGAGGHTEAIAQAVAPEGCVVAFDRDVAAIDRVESRLKALSANSGEYASIYGSLVRFAHANYLYFDEALDQLGIRAIDGFLLDLGLSSDQLADRSRGFSFDSDGPLDLRFDTTEGEPTWKMLTRLTAEQIADILYQYGEERCSRPIAREVVRRRENGQPIQTAKEFADLVRKYVPQKSRGRSGTPRSPRIDPATRSFQALRIAANDELGSLEAVLKKIPDFLRPGGRIAIISFHSLEDRIVKNAFREDKRLQIITKKPIEATDPEIEANPRSRSAKLRVAEKV